MSKSQVTLLEVLELLPVLLTDPELVFDLGLIFVCLLAYFTHYYCCLFHLFDHLANCYQQD